jgi:23S rRNA pseudouridine1911/1915/1917 synthase
MPDYSQPSATAPPAVATQRLSAHGAAGERLDRFLADRLEGVSRTRVQRWIALGAVRVEQALRLPSYRLVGHEEVEVEPQPLESEQAFLPDPVPLDILYRDDDIVVIDKPAGLVTHPAPGNWRNTLMNGLLHAWPRTARLPRAGIVHRLDRDTSGVIVCACSERAFVSLTAQLASRTMGRDYLAVVAGGIDAQGRIDAPIGRDPRNRLRMAVVHQGGKPAQTEYRVLARADAGQGRFAALACRLHTGRTHQIRVHLASIGHPLVGDAIYGGPAHAGFERQALHAWRLRLQHPGTAQALSVVAPIPADLRRLLESLGIAQDALPLPEAEATGA